jgi:hypothetical protein
VRSDVVKPAGVMPATGVGMPSSQPEEEMDGYSPEWRAAVLEVEQARQHYAKVANGGNVLSGSARGELVALGRVDASTHRDRPLPTSSAIRGQ